MIDSGMINDFYIDYQREQVVSRKYIPKMSHKTVVKCSGCGGNNEVIVGITQALHLLRAAAGAGVEIDGRATDVSTDERLRAGTAWD